MTSFCNCSTFSVRSRTNRSAFSPRSCFDEADEIIDDHPSRRSRGLETFICWNRSNWRATNAFASRSFELIGTIAKTRSATRRGGEEEEEVEEIEQSRNHRLERVSASLWHLVQSSDLKQLELGMCLFATLASYCSRFVLEHLAHTFTLISSMLKTRPSVLVCEQALIILSKSSQRSASENLRPDDLRSRSHCQRGDSVSLR